MIEFESGKVGIVHGDERISLEAYGEDGWPIDPATKERLRIADATLAESSTP